ncbi:hypothetical protein HUJ04_009402 [Dendroctonus ponderosae]|nr:hypothetical protein HUJ04_009402 [Dendroctonus ponderosae]
MSTAIMSQNAMYEFGDNLIKLGTIGRNNALFSNLDPHATGCSPHRLPPIVGLSIDNSEPGSKAQNKPKQARP